MAKYSQTTRNSDGNYETRVYTDYTQTAAEGIAGAAGTGIAILFGVIFMSKITLGSTLIIISLFVMGASAGWGFILLLTGVGFIAWWFHQRSQAQAEEVRVLAAEYSRVNEAQRQARSRAQVQSIPPTEPVVTLATDEVELTRFWTKQGGKALLTNRRLVVDHNSGAITMIRVPEITGVSLSYEDMYNATIQVPTVANPTAKLDFSSKELAQRVLGALRSAMLGAPSVASVSPDRIEQQDPGTTRTADSSASPTSPSRLPNTSPSGQHVVARNHVTIRQYPNTEAQILTQVPGESILRLRDARGRCMDAASSGMDQGTTRPERDGRLCQGHVSQASLKRDGNGSVFIGSEGGIGCLTPAPPTPASSQPR